MNNNIEHSNGGDDFRRSLDESLEPLARECPPGCVSTADIRKRLHAYREVLARHRAMIEEYHDRGGSGVDVCRMLSDFADRFILHVLDIESIFGVNGNGLAVVALGGYGRREMNPFSDIDLLFLTGGDGEEVFLEGITSVVKFIYDMKLNMGHSTRTPEQCIEAAHNDPYLATSLLEARLLTGDRAVWETLRTQYETLLAGGFGMNLAMSKIEERVIRHKQYNGTVQVRTPNVKESPGSLRDIHTVRWLTTLSGTCTEGSDPVFAGFLHCHEAPDFENSLDFLLRVRNALHFIAEKKADHLEHGVLPELARRLGYPGAKTVPAEDLMRSYYRNAGRVHRLTGFVIERFLMKFRSDGGVRFRTDPSGFRYSRTAIDFPVDMTAEHLRDNPGTAVRLFTVAGSRGLSLSERAASLIESGIHAFAGDFPGNAGVREAFHELVNMRTGIGRAFRLMHEHGVLVRILPEFEAISWYYQYDFYHAYTTDEHSIRVVENLEKMDRGSLPSLPGLTEIMGEITAKGALYLVGLLHDIGKAGGRAHSLKGERIAAHALECLGFDERTVGLVRFLIREHLLMSHVSQRRDTEDVDTIRDFVQQVSSAGRLRMLTLLTFADLMALSETAFTDWKKALLLDLYHKALALLEKGFEARIAMSGDKLALKVLGHIGNAVSASVVHDHLRLLPQQYVRVTKPARIGAHLRGIGLMEKRGVWASFQHIRDVTMLTVIMKDYPRALSDICGTITSSDIGITGAQIFTREDGIIIDTFLVVNDHGGAIIAPENHRAFKENLRRVVSREIDVAGLIRTHIDRWKRRTRKIVFIPPRIRIHNDISTRYTVIDVFATDYSGLLYDVSSVLASFNIDIHTAKIGTDEDQVADAFYVRTRGGGKIEDETLMKEITLKLEETLNKAR